MNFLMSFKEKKNLKQMDQLIKLKTPLVGTQNSM